MRAILTLIGLAAVVFAVLVATGMVSVSQTKTASFPTIKFQGGHAPEFKANTGSVSLGTTNATVTVPTVGTENKTIALPTLSIKKADKADGDDQAQ